MRVDRVWFSVNGQTRSLVVHHSSKWLRRAKRWNLVGETVHGFTIEGHFHSKFASLAETPVLTICHELIHVVQRENAKWPGLVTYYPTHLWHLARHGHQGGVYESEAYGQDDLIVLGRHPGIHVDLAMLRQCKRPPSVWMHNWKQDGAFERVELIWGGLGIFY